MHPGVILQFFERLEVFAYESVKKQEEFTERIKREVLKTPVLLIMASYYHNYNIIIQRKFCVL